MTTKKRFEKNFVKSDGCWIWTGAKTGPGYGQFWFRGKNHRANRVSWEIYRSGIPDDMCVLHTCDNILCVNPSHLWIGTQSDNQLDSVKKGRHGSITQPETFARGERNGASKLKENDVELIRAMGGKLSLRKIGKMFGVQHNTVAYILRGQTWKDL